MSLADPILERPRPVSIRCVIIPQQQNRVYILPQYFMYTFIILFSFADFTENSATAPQTR